MKLKKANSEHSPITALEILRSIQRHSIRIDSNPTIKGISTISVEQAEILAQLQLPTPI